MLIQECHGESKQSNRILRVWTFQETLQGFSGSCMVLEASEGLRGSGRDLGDLEGLGGFVII